jgi:hypothetical protein
MPTRVPSRVTRRCARNQDSFPSPPTANPAAESWGEPRKPFARDRPVRALTKNLQGPNRKLTLVAHRKGPLHPTQLGNAKPTSPASVREHVMPIGNLKSNFGLRRGIRQFYLRGEEVVHSCGVGVSFGSTLPRGVGVTSRVEKMVDRLTEREVR